VESLSLLYLNPPYDFECGQSQNRRLEQIFFEHCYRVRSKLKCPVFVAHDLSGFKVN